MMIVCIIISYVELHDDVLNSYYVLQQCYLSRLDASSAEALRKQRDPSYFHGSWQRTMSQSTTVIQATTLRDSTIRFETG